MKKFLFIAVISLLWFQQSQASGSDLFSINEDQIRTEMAELTLLENFVNQNQDVTLSEMQLQANPLSEIIVSGNLELESLAGASEMMGGIPAFLWGFCLGPIGILVAYLIDEDNLMMSIVGCLVSSVLFGGGYLLI